MSVSDRVCLFGGWTCWLVGVLLDFFLVGSCLDEFDVKSLFCWKFGLTSWGILRSVGVSSVDCGSCVVLDSSQAWYSVESVVSWSNRFCVGVG